MPQSIHLERDIDELFQARQSLVRRGKDCRELSALWLLRETATPSESPVSTLLIIPKRFVRRSHDRHRIQRWIREATRLSPILLEVEELLRSQQKEALLGIRCQNNPSRSVNWAVINSDVQILLEHLLKVIKRF
jgi:ribonuclease P protein component